jgi:bifunctional pyridoxal-dependent enzyme with beta-cystathionase and maltose regulon repressor activities
MELARCFFEERLPELKFLKPEGTILALLDWPFAGPSSTRTQRIFPEKARVYFDEGPICVRS